MSKPVIPTVPTEQYPFTVRVLSSRGKLLANMGFHRECRREAETFAATLADLGFPGGRRIEVLGPSGDIREAFEFNV